MDDNASLWSISTDLDRLWSPYGHDLSFATIAYLLVTNEPALQAFLSQLSTTMDQRFGDNSFLERAVADYKLRHPAVPAPKLSDHRTPQPHDKGDGY